MAANLSVVGNDWQEQMNRAQGAADALRRQEEAARLAQWERTDPSSPSNVAKQQAALRAAANQAAAMADPWASQRGQYQTSLSQLLNNPGAAMQNNPFFQWQQSQGLDAVNRKMAASGGRVSGNRMMALSDYAQNQSGQNFFQLADLYSLLGGAKNQNPAAAAQISYQGAQDAAQVPWKAKAVESDAAAHSLASFNALVNKRQNEWQNNFAQQQAGIRNNLAQSADERAWFNTLSGGAF